MRQLDSIINSMYMNLCKFRETGKGQGNLAYCSSRGCKESDTTQRLNNHKKLFDKQRDQDIKIEIPKKKIEIPHPASMIHSRDSKPGCISQNVLENVNKVDNIVFALQEFPIELQLQIFFKGSLKKITIFCGSDHDINYPFSVH